MAARLTHAWLGTLAANSAYLLCGLLTGVLAARLLLPEGRGILAAMIFWPNFIALLGLLSLPNAITFRTAQAGERRAGVAASGLWLTLALVGMTLLLGGLLLPLVVSDRALLPLAAAFFLAFIPFNLFAATLLAIDQGEMRFARYNVLRLVPHVTYLLGLLLLWAVDAVSVGTALCAVWLGMFMAVLLRLFGKGCFTSWRPSSAEMARLLRISLGFHGTTIVGVLLAHADRVIVISLWNSAAVGHYVVAFTLASAGLSAITGAFSTLLVPRLAAAPTLDRQRQLMTQTLRYATLLTSGGAALALGACPWLIPLLFSKAYDEAVSVCMVLLLAYVPGVLRQLILNALVGLGEWRPRLAAEGLALATFAAVVWPTARWLDLEGVAVAMLVANSVSLLYLLGFLGRRLNIGPSEWWGLNMATTRQAVAHLWIATAGFRHAVAKK